MEKRILMTERERYMLCCDCGYAVKEKTMFIKKYKNTAFCLCKKYTTKLYEELREREENAGNIV